MIPPNPSANGNGNGASPDPLRGALTPAMLHLDGFGNPIAAPTAPPNGIQLFALLKALRRRWFLGFSLALLLGACGALAAWLFLPPSKYVARTRLEVDARDPRILFENAFGHGDFPAFQRHQMAMVKTRLVLNSALNQPKVADLLIVRMELEPLDWLEREIKVDFSQSPNIMQISMTGEEPDQMVTLVNAVREAYLREVVNKELDRRHQHLQKLDDAYVRYQDNLEDRRRKLKAMAEQQGVSGTAMAALRQTLILQELGWNARKLGEIRSELLTLAAKRAGQQDEEKSLEKLQIPEAQIERALDEHPLVKQQADEVAKAEAAYNRVKSSFEKGAKALEKFVLAIDEAKAKMNQTRKEVRPTVEDLLRGAASRDVKTGVVETRNQITHLKRLEALIQQDVDTLTKESEKFKKQSAATLDIDFLEKEVAQVEDMLKKIGTQKEAMKFELPAPPRVRELEPGVASRNQDDKKRLLATLVAGLAGIGVALFGVAWREYRVRRIDTLDEVATGLGMRIVGAIPGMPTRNWRNWVTSTESRNHYWRRLLTESVDAARTMLLHSAGTESLKTVMISSAVGGEGKTSLASHLSASLARAGRKTLLIDGDIRKPSLHKLFEAAQAPGLAEYLRSEVDPAAAVQPTSVNGLYLISAGHGDARAIQFLARDRMRALLHALREEFDFILIDTSPVLPVADALLIAQHVDGVLFSILRDVSKFPKVYAAYQRLTSVGARILGAVVNGTRTESYGGSDYYYYYAGRVGATDASE